VGDQPEKAGGRALKKEAIIHRQRIIERSEPEHCPWLLLAARLS